MLARAVAGLIHRLTYFASPAGQADYAARSQSSRESYKQGLLDEADQLIATGGQIENPPPALAAQLGVLEEFRLNLSTSLSTF